MAAVVVPVVLALGVALSGGSGNRGLVVAALCAVALLATAIGWVVIAASTSRRVERIAQAVDNLATGTGPASIGDPIPDDIGALGSGVDRLGQRLADTQRARSEAEHEAERRRAEDPLTGLRSRHWLVAKVEALLQREERADLSVLFVDIDDFRLVNELWGQHVGDEVLVTVANRLRRTIGDGGEIGRWGSDEFVVLVEGIDRESIIALAARLKELFNEPINSSVGPHPLSISIGMAFAEQGSDATLDTLIQSADLRMLDEKRQQRQSRSISHETAHFVEVALSDGGLEVWYQPLVALTSPTATRMVGAEALVRLRTADGTLRNPGDFLSEIADTPYAVEIDDRMAAQVIANLAAWQSSGLVPADFQVSLNLSPASLGDLDLANRLSDRCAEHDVSASSIVLELSEEAGEIDQIVASELRATGFRLSIDDLGLKRSNFDRLFGVGAQFAKLHRRWLDDEVMLDALVSICQRKGLQVVAEGVETMGQLTQLFERGVRLCQGYVISRPMAEVDFVGLLAKGRRGQ